MTDRDTAAIVDDPAQVDDQESAGPRRRVSPITVAVTLLVGLAGLAMSAYLTYEHFTGSTTLACPGVGTIDCHKVTTSSYSQFVGVPVSVLGLVFFVALVPLLTPWAWRSPAPLVRWGRVAAVVVGMVSVLYLVWAELFGVGAICLWCTGVHVVTFVLFVAVVFVEALAEPEDAPGDGLDPTED